jgi:hypothetical protein
VRCSECRKGDACCLMITQTEPPIGAYVCVVMSRTPATAANSVRALVSERQRPGRRFQPILERELESTARWVASELPGADSGVLALTEFHAPFGVPDLTVVAGSPEARRRRLRLNVPPILNEVDAGIVSATLTDEVRSVAQIANSLGWSESSVHRRIDSVCRMGAVRRHGDGRFTRPAALVPIGTIWAIELKVSEWRRALTQCRTYLTWADGYVLVLGTLSGASRNQLEDLISSDGGGLVLDSQWVVRPSHRSLPEARRLWSSEHLIAGRRRR